jgi:hypothetical protein
MTYKWQTNTHVNQHSFIMMANLNRKSIWNRPFNLQGELWFFVSFRIFFSDNTRVRIFPFFIVQSANFFFQNSTLGYMTNTLNQIIIFFGSPSKSKYFFQQRWESEYFFRKKTITPPSN